MEMFVFFAQPTSIAVLSVHQMELPVLNVLLVTNWILEHALIAKQDFITPEHIVDNAHQL